jgi:hypothetical protein
MIQNTTPQTVTPPANQDKTDFKDFVRVLVVLCNEKIKNFHISRLIENADTKEDLIEYMDHFDELFLNTKDLIVYNKPNLAWKIPNKADLTITELCDLVEKWVSMEKYTDNPDIQTIFTDGIDLFNYYLKALISTGIYEAR